MKDQDWHKRWQEGDTPWAHPTANELFYKNIERVEEYIDGDGVFKALVPLCGNSEVVRYLFDWGYDVTGVELVPDAFEMLVEQHFADIALEEVQSESQIYLKADRLTLVCGDIYECDFQERFNLIYDRGGLVAFPPTHHKKYAQNLERMLAPAGLIYIATYWADGFIPDQPPYPVEPKQLAELFSTTEEVFAEKFEAEPTVERYIQAGVRVMRKQHTLLRKALAK